MSDVILKIDNVSKQYRLGQIGGTTLRDELQRFGAKIRGKEDPTKQIGAKDYNKGETFMALDGISFEVKKGERVGIIGHNGAGKSTLLKLISRVTAPTSGAIGLNGRVASMLEVGTGFHGELTGRENIYMNGAILGMTKKEIDAKIEDIIEFSECRQFIDTPVKRYSSGMYVKLAFSVAAHLDSEIMIMDEVLAVGDMAFQKKCLNKMSDVSKTEGRTILYVSHNMNTIRQLCDRVIVLSRGKVIFDGEVEEAIRVYMNQTDLYKIQEKNLINLESLERPCDLHNKVLMQQIKFLNDTLIFENGDSIAFYITWKAFENLSDVKFRAIVRYSNDTPVGLITSNSIGDAEAGHTYTTKIEFDSSLLADGKYYLSIAFYQDNPENGQSVIIDHISRAFSIEIISNVNDKTINWEHTWWGSVRFPKFTTESFNDIIQDLGEKNENN